MDLLILNPDIIQYIEFKYYSKKRTLIGNKYKGGASKSNYQEFCQNIEKLKVLDSEEKYMILVYSDFINEKGSSYNDYYGKIKGEGVHKNMFVKDGYCFTCVILNATAINNFKIEEVA